MGLGVALGSWWLLSPPPGRAEEEEGSGRNRLGWPGSQGVGKEFRVPNRDPLVCFSSSVFS